MQTCYNNWSYIILKHMSPYWLVYVPEANATSPHSCSNDSQKEWLRTVLLKCWCIYMQTTGEVWLKCTDHWGLEWNIFVFYFYILTSSQVVPYLFEEHALYSTELHTLVTPYIKLKLNLQHSHKDSIFTNILFITDHSDMYLWRIWLNLGNMASPVLVVK